MTKNWLLLDTDVIVDCNELGYWKGLLSNYDVCVGSIVASEVRYYHDEEGNKVALDLQAHITPKEIVELSASPQEMSSVLDKLRESKLDGLESGELECITIAYTNQIPELKLCIIDHAAIKAVSYLGLESKTLSLQEVLITCGMLRRKEQIPYTCSKKRFDKYVTEGKFSLLESEKQNRN